MIQNLGSLIKEIKKHLPEYLREHGINTNSKLFKCPNYRAHHNEDLKPSANFFPDTTSWHCFSCEYSTKLGDIFDAVHLLEGKDITGENFFEVVKYLCKKYKIPYHETTSEEEKFLTKINTYFKLLTDKANNTLKTLLPKLPKVQKLLQEKHWDTEIDNFKLGYLNIPFIVKGYEDVIAYLNLNPVNIVNRIIIPIIVSGKIVGITTRTVEDSTAKYKHFVSYSIKKILFNIDKIDKSKEVYIVEGPSSCVTLSKFGIKNVVATFGNYFHPNQLNFLIKHKIKNIIFLYDGDGGGYEGLRNSLINLSTSEISTKIGLLNDNLDPADYIIKNKSFNNLKTISILDYLIKEYASNTQDKYIEKCLMKYINTIEDPVLKEKAINIISKQAKINKSTIADLLSLYAQNLGGKISDLLKERDSLINTLTSYEKWTWSRGNLLGLKSFKSLDIRLDGIQDGMVLVGGIPNVGKSMWLNSLALKMLKENENIYILYFTIDDSIYTTISRLVANLSELPINVVSNPNFKINKANLPEAVKKDYIMRRENALDFLRSKSNCFNIKDATDATTIEKIRNIIDSIVPLTHGKKLVIFIDNLHNLRSERSSLSDRHLYSYISNQINNIATTYQCPVICSVHITKDAIKNKQFDGSSIKETVELFYDAKLIMFVDSEVDLENIDRDDIEIKIHISKNKQSGFKGVLNFIAYRSISKIKENNNAEKRLFS